MEINSEASLFLTRTKQLYENNSFNIPLKESAKLLFLLILLSKLTLKFLVLTQKGNSKKIIINPNLQN